MDRFKVLLKDRVLIRSAKKRLNRDNKSHSAIYYPIAIDLIMKSYAWILSQNIELYVIRRPTVVEGVVPFAIQRKI